MAVDIKCQLIFRLHRWGWSETYYKNGTNIEQVHDQLKLLANARSKLVSPPAEIEAIRSSDIAIRGDALVSPYSATGTIDFGAEASDVPWTGWLVSLRSGNLYRRSLLLRGVPDDTVKTAGEFKVDPAEGWKKAVDKYIKYLVDNSWAMRAVNNEPLNPPKPITAATEAVGTGVWTLTVGAHGYASGDRVRIRGGLGLENIRGVRYVTALDANRFTVTAATPGGFYLGGGTTQKVFYTIFPLTHGNLLRVAKRDTGRPFFLTRGRQAAKRK